MRPSEQPRTAAGLNVWLPNAPQFELHERRDIGSVDFVATPTPQLDLKATYTMNRHVGELPWGASFGFGNDVEVPLPYDSRANDFTLGAEWTNTRKMINVAYTGSWFDNLDTPLIWDSPLRLDDSTSAPGRGRTALWPSNSAQTVSIGGFSKWAHRTQLTGFLSFGSWKNDETLQPFTINSALTQLPLPRNTTAGDAGIFSTNLNLVSRPQMDWRFSARFRRYDYSNNTPHFTIDKVHELRHVDQQREHRRPRALRPQSNELRCGRDLDRAKPGGADRGIQPEQHRTRFPNL